MSKWMRAIDSAQRLVEVSPELANKSDLTALAIHIQGITLTSPQGPLHHSWPDLAEQGVRAHQQKPLSILDRLLRKEAAVGEIRSLSVSSIQMTFWTRPPLVLTFDITDETQKSLMRECEIMALSGGFHFVMALDPKHGF